MKFLIYLAVSLLFALSQARHQFGRHKTAPDCFNSSYVSCRDGTPCPSGQYCDGDGFCCSDPPGCPADQQNGHCYNGAECPKGFDCSEGGVCCQSFVCPWPQQNGTCGEDAGKIFTCPNGYQCQHGNCCPQPACVAAVQAGTCYYNETACPRGYSCDPWSKVCCPTVASTMVPIIMTSMAPTMAPSCNSLGPCIGMSGCPSGSSCNGTDCCATCVDQTTKCQTWAENGFCTNPYYSTQDKQLCAKTCGLCH